MAPEADYLTEALETFPPIIAFAGRIDIGEPWSVGVSEGIALVAIVTKGSFLATHRGSRESARVAAGDVLFLSPGAEHQLSLGRDSKGSSMFVGQPMRVGGLHGQEARGASSAGLAGKASIRAGEIRRAIAPADIPRSRTIAYPDWIAVGRGEHPHVLSYLGDEGAVDVSLVGGLLEFDDPCVHPFLWALPPLVHLSEEAAGESVHLPSLRRSPPD